MHQPLDLLGRLPGEQHLRCGSRRHRQLCADRHRVAQSAGALRRRDAAASVARASVKLSAFVGDVAQPGQHRAGRLLDGVHAQLAAELRQSRTEVKPALRVAGDETVVLERDRQSVRRGTRQPAAGHELRQGRGARLECRQDANRFVENADTASLFHTAILPSRMMRKQIDGDRRSAMGRTMAEKVWDAHVVVRDEGKPDLLYIDLHLIHEVTSPQAFDGLRAAGRPVRRPDLTLATEDHNVPTTDGPITDVVSRTQVETLRKNCAEFGVRLHPMGDEQQGIVHVIGPQLGLTQPGMTVVCGDSHTSTHGAFGALAFGIGTSEVEHVLATQTLPLQRPRTMAVEVDGPLPDGVTAKDLILGIITQIGTGGGQGYIVEYRGEAIRSLSMEGRMTVCNMSIEAGARAGMIAPDETTFDYLRGRDHAPKGAEWDAAVEQWRELVTDDDAQFDRVVRIDASALAPWVTWGTNPGQGAALSSSVPDPESFADPSERAAAARALSYMALTPGTALRDVAVDTVFIGSCTNGRLEDLRAAADVLRGRQVASGVRVLVVPGSVAVRIQAESEGLHEVFSAAGAEWRGAGCSMCLGMNPDKLAPGERSASTSNRNFEGRQGPGGRTHLVSPAVAAATAVTGHLASPADL